MGVSVEVIGGHAQVLGVNVEGRRSLPQDQGVRPEVIRGHDI
jgi:hypothetical protein